MKQTASVEKVIRQKQIVNQFGQFVTLSVLLLLENNKTQISPNFTENFQELLEQNK